MPLQKYFKPKRFINYFKYDLASNYKLYTFFSIGLFIALLFFQFFALASAKRTFNLNDYILIFYLAIVPGMISVIGSSFPALRNQSETTNYLMLPVASFEKFSVQFIIRGILFPCLFIILFWLEFKLSKYLYLLFDWSYVNEIHNFKLFDFLAQVEKQSDKIVLILSFFSVAMFFFTGATFFKKYAVYKTLFTFAFLLGAVFLFSITLSHIFYPEMTQGFEIEIESYNTIGNLGNVQVCVYSIGALSSLFLLPLAYFNLKGKEV